MKILFGFILILVSSSSQAKDYSWLKMFDTPPENWAFEVTPDLEARDLQEAPAADLSPFYQAFEADKVVTIGLAWGKDAAYAGRSEYFATTLAELLRQENITIDEWKHDKPKREISFRRVQGSVRFVIHYSDERNDYINFYSNKEVVMYHGHSRYGRGPAFGNYQNYFRMGLDWDNIEVGADNPYFLKEPITLTERYPLQQINIDNKTYDYQYYGARKHDDYDYFKKLYVKNIDGNGVDFRKTSFLPGKQFFWYYSCKNIKYWKSVIRQKFPGYKEKFVFGTKKDSYWGNAPAAVFIMDLVIQKTLSHDITKDLDATKDCEDDCFTTF